MPSRSSAKCFVSYCWDDIDRPALEVLLRELRRNLNDQVDFIMDEEALRHGESITQFTRLLREVDGVLVIMTPAYNEKVVNRRGGVEKEYSIIVERFFGRKRGATDSGEAHFTLLPVLFAGTRDSAVPGELLDYKYADLTRFRVTSPARGKPKMTSGTSRLYKKKIREMAEELSATFMVNSDGYESLFEEYFADLFGELKLVG